MDPFPAATEVAAKFAVPLYFTLAELFEIDNPDGVIQATPKQMHVAASLESVAADVLLIVKKPIGDSVEAVTQLVHGRGVHHRATPGRGRGHGLNHLGFAHRHEDPVPELHNDGV